MKLTPAQVKNLMRRGLRLLIDPDPEPEERQRVYDFFAHECAYCGAKIPPGGGDLDHLVSASRGGTNHLSNRVLSCKRCNAEEKREQDWLAFLTKKSPDIAVFERRKEHIECWIRSLGGVRVMSEELRRLIAEESAKATAAYDVACQSVRRANKAPEPTPMLGTSAAEQPLVPSTGVAHL